MEVVRSLDDWRSEAPSVVTIGAFDGVHIGHQTIMGMVKSFAHDYNSQSVVVTFDQDPEELVNPQGAPPYITTLRQKLKLIEAQGIDSVLVLPLEKKLMDMTPEEFVRKALAEKLKAAKLIVGSNFSLGKGRAGNVDTLRSMGEKYGFELVSVSPVRINGSLVSSTAIRRLILDGKVEKANELLGHAFTLEGEVVEGEGIGRALGYPTANIMPAKKQIVPQNGVYAVTAKWDDNEKIGVANIGVRPTIGNKLRSIEVYLINFSGNIYKRNLEIEFFYRLRDEIRFSDTKALCEQIKLDIQETLRLTSGTGCNRH